MNPEFLALIGAQAASLVAAGSGAEVQSARDAAHLGGRGRNRSAPGHQDDGTQPGRLPARCRVLERAGPSPSTFSLQRQVRSWFIGTACWFHPKSTVPPNKERRSLPRMASSGMVSCRGPRERGVPHTRFGRAESEESHLYRAVRFLVRRRERRTRAVRRRSFSRAALMGSVFQHHGRRRQRPRGGVPELFGEQPDTRVRGADTR
jgi:hypothetical protein